MHDFGIFDGARVVAEDELCVVVRDKYPVSPRHTLIVVRRLVARFQTLTVL